MSRQPSTASRCVSTGFVCVHLLCTVRKRSSVHRFVNVNIRFAYPHDPLTVTDGVTVKNYYKKKIKNGPRGCVLCPTTNIQLFHQKKIKSSQVHPKSKVHPVSRTGTHGHHMCSHCHSAFSSHVSDLSCLEMPPLTLRMPPGRRARSQRAAAHPCTRLVSGLGLQDAGPWRSSTQSIVWSKTNVWFVNCAYAS
jgi:hypothetical protein